MAYGTRVALGARRSRLNETIDIPKANAAKQRVERSAMRLRIAKHNSFSPACHQSEVRCRTLAHDFAVSGEREKTGLGVAAGERKRHLMEFWSP